MNIHHIWTALRSVASTSELSVGNLSALTASGRAEREDGGIAFPYPAQGWTLSRSLWGCCTPRRL